MIILAVTLSQVVLRTGSELDLIHLSGIVFLSIRSAMAEPEALALEGPGQNGRGKHGQYVYWIVMAHPTPETLAQQAVKTPEDFTTSTPKSLPSLCQSTSTRPKCPRHTKNHHFGAGACLGACWFLKEKKFFYFKKQQAPEQEPALKCWFFVRLGHFGRVLVDWHRYGSDFGVEVANCNRSTH